MNGNLLKTDSKKISIISVTDRINETIKETYDTYDPRSERVIGEARQAVEDRKLLIYTEGPLGIGKSTLARRLAKSLGSLPYSLENPEAPEVKRYLEMLYHPEIDVKKIGALGVNTAYYSQRMAHEETARLAARSYVLDRRRRFDKIYMDEFVKVDLMKAEDRDRIIAMGDDEMKLLHQRGSFTGLKEVVIQMVGSPELVHRRKNNRGRDVEKETKEGGGVDIGYMTQICNVYLQSPKVLEEEGFEGLVIEVGQELNDRKEFSPRDESHLLPILEVLIAYAKSKGPILESIDFKRT